MKKITISLIAGMCMAAVPFTSSAATNYVRKPQVIENAQYPTQDVKIIEMNILDYEPNANGGVINVTSTIQSMLNALGDQASYPAGESQAYRKTGGTLYLPAGTYKIDGRINVPRGVSIRGDWKKPVKGEKIEGTILKVTSRFANDTVETNSAFIMEPSTQIADVAIWYETQNATTPIAYPPSIVYGKKGYFGNDYCNVRNVTLVNSYIGVVFSELNGGGCPNIFGLYGTPLYKGVTMDNIADVGRFDHIDFSPKYWAGSGLANAADATAWTYYNATGFEMRRNDWSYCCNYSAEGYNRGFWAKKSPEIVGSQGSPNGHNYNLKFTNCRTGVYITESAGCGCMFTRVSTPGCEVGLGYGAGDAGPSQFLACDLSGTRYAIQSAGDASQTTQLQQCNVTGKVDFAGGQLIADNNTFNGDVELAALTRCVFTSNKFTSGSLINHSLYECKIDNTPRSVKAVPEYPEELMEVKDTKPAKTDLFLASDYGAVGIYIDPVDKTHGEDASHDNAAAIQKALDAAGANGGGIVYLTPGHYRCNSPLSIPTGVELRGASDLASVPRGQGAILEVYTGEGSDNGTPFITMAAKSGLRGISINYPNQDESIFSEVSGGVVDGVFKPAYSVCTPKKYPYAVRGNADTYVVNLGLRACYLGVDMFTNKCDNHYVDYISGHCFKNVIRVGGNSQDGTISNIQCNSIAYAAGDEWKYGLWPNSLHCKNGLHQDAVYQQNYDELDFFIIGDCKNENLYNNFLFGSATGMLFQSDGNGGATFHSLGNAVDGVVKTFVFKAIAADASMINSQLVALNNQHSASFFTTEAGFNRTVDMFATNNWGGGDTFADIKGGTVNFILAALQQSGEKNTFVVDNPAKFNMYNFNVRSNNKNTNGNKNVNLYSGIFSPLTDDGKNSFDTKLFGTYSNILTMAWNMQDRSAFKDRDNWHAIAFNDVYGKIMWQGELQEGLLIKDFGDRYEEIPNDFYVGTKIEYAGDGVASRALDNDMSTRWSTKGSQNPPVWYDANANSEPKKDPEWGVHDLQFFAVFFDQDLMYGERTEHINAIILDSSNSPNDGPAAWQLQVLDDDSEEQIIMNEPVPQEVIDMYSDIMTPEELAEVMDPISENADAPIYDPVSGDFYAFRWRTVARGNSAGSLLIAPFPEEDVRAVRIVQTGTRGNYWSIHEIYAAMIEGLNVSGIEDTMLNEQKNLFYAEGTLIIAAELFNSDGSAQVEVYDLSGRKVKDFTTTAGQVKIDGLGQGVYVVRVNGASLKIMNK